VLFPTVTREILLGVAGQGLYQPLWSARILEEWARAARKTGPEGEAITRGEIALLRANWPRSEVPPSPGLEARLHLPDDNDIHVLAAAITGHADRLITFNASDFPKSSLAEEGILRQDPDGFLYDHWLQDPDPVEAVCARVLKTLCDLSGQDWRMQPLLKKARLYKLGKALRHL
jgi:hypothetical protein